MSGSKTAVVENGLVTVEWRPAELAQPEQGETVHLDDDTSVRIELQLVPHVGLLVRPATLSQQQQPSLATVLTTVRRVLSARLDWRRRMGLQPPTRPLPEKAPPTMSSADKLLDLGLDRLWQHARFLTTWPAQDVLDQAYELRTLIPSPVLSRASWQRRRMPIPQPEEVGGDWLSLHQIVQSDARVQDLLRLPENQGHVRALYMTGSPHLDRFLSVGHTKQRQPYSPAAGVSSPADLDPLVPPGFTVDEAEGRLAACLVAALVGFRVDGGEGTLATMQQVGRARVEDVWQKVAAFVDAKALPELLRS